MQVWRKNHLKYNVGDAVWYMKPVRTKGFNPKIQIYWKGPYVVTGRLNDVLYCIQVGSKDKPDIVHQHANRPYLWDDQPTWFAPSANYFVQKLLHSAERHTVMVEEKLRILQSHVWIGILCQPNLIADFIVELLLLFVTFSMGDWRFFSGFYFPWLIVVGKCCRNE